MCSKNCLTCANREKSDYGAEGSDFWRCIAPAILPEFVVHHGRHHYRLDTPMRLVNLNLFRDPAPTAPGLKRDCPLWAASVVERIDQ